MRVRRKFTSCPNCGQMLERKDNFCPHCGQENDDKNVSANILFSEFMGTYFSLDSSFFKSVKPFLIRPGFLTNQFNSGKRKSYANPVRLYLILSIFYFFIVSIFGVKVASDKDKMSDKDLIEIRSDDDSDPDYVDAHERDSVLREAEKYSNMWKSDTIQYSTNKDKDSTDFILNRLNWQLVKDLKHEDEYSDQEVLDSMKLGGLSFYEDYLARQVIRINRSDTESVVRYLLQNLPLMMLLVIPLFALMLKVVYYRSKTLYVKHIIHALHLHSFAYLIYGIGLLLIMYLLKSEEWRLAVWFAGYFLVFAYAYISFKKVYNQGWVKSFFKFFLVGAGYSFLIFLFFIIEASLSFLLY